MEVCGRSSQPKHKASSAIKVDTDPDVKPNVDIEHI